MKKFESLPEKEGFYQVFGRDKKGKYIVKKYIPLYIWVYDFEPDKNDFPGVDSWELREPDGSRIEKF